MNPFKTIVRVVQTDLTITAYDDVGLIVAELTEDGLVDLLDSDPLITVETLNNGVAARPQRPGNPEFTVQVMATGPVFLDSGASPDMVDGVPARPFNLVLVAYQPDPKKNGIYLVTRSITTLREPLGHIWRLSSQQPSAGDVIWVENGVTHGKSSWTWRSGRSPLPAGNFAP